MIKERNYARDYGQRLARKRDQMGFPRDVIFEVTHRCNLRCRHCYLTPQPGKKELSSHEMKSVFDQLTEAGCFHVTLTGGEPLTRKDILAQIDYARRLGLSLHLFTNATLVTPQIADKLKDFQLLSVEISLHSLKRERFDWFTRVAGSYDKVMQAINLLGKKKIKIAMKINITTENSHEMEELKVFAEDVGAKAEWTTELTPRLDRSKDNLSFRLEPEAVVNLKPKIFAGPDTASRGERITKSLNDQRGMRTRGRLFQCGAGRRGLAITPYGELKPCLELPAPGYSVFTKGLQEGWKMLGNYVSSFKSDPDNRCFDCRLRDFCSSCPARAWLECGDMNACPAYYHRLAELRKEELTSSKRKRTEQGEH
jgi:radical SAM protein with 4Fe4S-binding SPASM domain